MNYPTEKTFTLEFHEDGTVTIEASGYTETLDPQFAAGQAKDLDALRHKHVCLADCHELIRQLGEVESITPKKPAPVQKAPNRLHLT